MKSELVTKLDINSDFDAMSFQINNLKLNSSVRDIKIDEITDIYVNQTGYENLKFSDRLELLKNTNGWVHCTAGVSFEVINTKVVRIKIGESFFRDKVITKKELTSYFGMPDNELIDSINFTAFDYQISSKILVFKSRKVNAFIHPKTEILKELHLGTLDEKIYF